MKRSLSKVLVVVLAVVLFQTPAAQAHFQSSDYMWKDGRCGDRGARSGPINVVGYGNRQAIVNHIAWHLGWNYTDGATNHYFRTHGNCRQFYAQRGSAGVGPWERWHVRFFRSYPDGNGTAMQAHYDRFICFAHRGGYYNDARNRIAGALGNHHRSWWEWWGNTAPINERCAPDHAGDGWVFVFQL